MTAKIHNKFVTLHHELFYPAFLGAVMFEFAKKLIEDGWTNFDRLWFFSALWFVLYFSLAFLSLAEAEATATEEAKANPPKDQSFGLISFVANLAEIAVILYFSTAINLVTREGSLTDLYVAWILIPITAFISNGFSKRQIRWLLSGLALAFAIVGKCMPDPRGAYPIVLLLMYGLLLVYTILIFADRQSFLRNPSLIWKPNWKCKNISWL